MLVWSNQQSTAETLTNLFPKKIIVLLQNQDKIYAHHKYFKTHILPA